MQRWVATERGFRPSPPYKSRQVFQVSSVWSEDNLRSEMLLFSPVCLACMVSSLAAQQDSKEEGENTMSEKKKFVLHIEQQYDHDLIDKCPLTIITGMLKAVGYHVTKVLDGTERNCTTCQESKGDGTCSPGFKGGYNDSGDVVCVNWLPKV